MRRLALALLGLSTACAHPPAPPAPAGEAPSGPDVPVVMHVGPSALEVRVEDAVRWYRRGACKKQGVRASVASAPAPYLVAAALRSTARAVDVSVHEGAPEALVAYVKDALQAKGRLGETRAAPAPGEAACEILHTAAEAAAAPGEKTGRRIVKDDVAAAVQAKLAEIKTCYEVALKDDRRLAGRVTVQFAIGADGRVYAATPTEDSVGADVAACTVARVREMTLPETSRYTVVSYPFTFGSRS